MGALDYLYVMRGDVLRAGGFALFGWTSYGVTERWTYGTLTRLIHVALFW
jgi:hypothetical protein